MNKQQFIDWIKSLPDDFEMNPVDVSEITENFSPWVTDYDAVPTVFNSAYKRTVRTNMKLDITFEAELSGEFKRDNFGHEHWTNIRMVK